MNIKRKCQACNTVKEIKELIKITKINNSLIINPNSNQLGRSAYVCKNKECICTLIKKKRLKNALKYNNMEEIEKIHEQLLKLSEN